MPQEIIRLPIKGEFVDIAILSRDDSKPDGDIEMAFCDDVVIEEDRVAMLDTVFGKHQILSLSISVFVDDKYVGDINKTRGLPFFGGPQFQDVAKYLFCGNNLRFFLKAGYIRLSRGRNGLGYDAIYAYKTGALNFRNRYEASHISEIAPIFAMARDDTSSTYEDIIIKAVSKDFIYVEYYCYEPDVGEGAMWFLVRHETSSNLSQPIPLKVFEESLQVGDEIYSPLWHALDKFGVKVTDYGFSSRIISVDDSGIVLDVLSLPSYMQLKEFFLTCNAGRGGWNAETIG